MPRHTPGSGHSTCGRACRLKREGRGRQGEGEVNQESGVVVVEGSNSRGDKVTDREWGGGQRAISPPVRPTHNQKL